MARKLDVVWSEGDRLTITAGENYAHYTDYEIRQRSVDELNLTSQNLMVTEDRTERV